jgi:hypothetical protein
MSDEQYDRGVKVRLQLDQMVNHLSSLDVGLPLIWLWVWDVVRSKYDLYSEGVEDYIITDDTTLDIIWDRLWANPPSDFTLEYGAEAIDDAIMDWMIEEGFLASLDEDGWLDEEDEDASDI